MKVDSNSLIFGRDVSTYLHSTSHVLWLSSHASTYVVYIEFVNFAEKYRWDKSTDLPNFSLDIRLIIYLLGRLIKADNIRYLKAYCPIIFTVNHFRDTNQLIFWMKSNSDNNVGIRKKYIKNWTNSKWSIISSIKYINDYLYQIFDKLSDKHHFGEA